MLPCLFGLLQQPPTDDADQPIRTFIRNPKAVAVVVGIANYHHPDVPKVEFAIHDATTIKKLLIDTLGYSESRVLLRTDAEASLARLRPLLRQELKAKVITGESDVFVYYSGHGAPSAETREGFLIPWDYDPRHALSEYSAYPLKQFYDDLAVFKARSLTVMLEACFTGQSDSGVVVKDVSPVFIDIDMFPENPAAILPEGVVISATGRREIATWHREKEHGLLTYYFLEGLGQGKAADARGRVSVAGLEKYLKATVPQAALELRGRNQNPQIFTLDPGRVLAELPVSALRRGDAVEKFGSLEITIDGGGDLYIDGVLQGEIPRGQPFVRHRIRIGPYQVKVVKGSKSIEDRVIVRPELTEKIHYTLGGELSDKTPDDVPEMVPISGGKFRMGSEKGYKDEKPVYQVTVSDFVLGRYEVTNREFAEFVEEMKERGYRTDAEKRGWSWCLRDDRWQQVKGADWKHPNGPGSTYRGKERHPVVHVSWNDANAYCQWLERKTGRSHRLPTEAEWEYACRAGITQEYWWGDEFELQKANTASRHAGFKIVDVENWNKWRDKDKRTLSELLAEVGFSANKSGLYDMAGNVWEWCSSQYRPYPYRADDGRENPGDLSTDRVLRGGSWHYKDGLPRSARRGLAKPIDSYDTCGFRVAR